jgi:hypothetical protein
MIFNLEWRCSLGLNFGDALIFPCLDGSSVVDKEKTSEVLYAVLMISALYLQTKGMHVKLMHRTITSADTVK